MYKELKGWFRLLIYLLTEVEIGSKGSQRAAKGKKGQQMVEKEGEGWQRGLGVAKEGKGWQRVAKGVKGQQRVTKGSK